jgi:hypothetical protein
MILIETIFALAERKYKNFRNKPVEALFSTMATRFFSQKPLNGKKIKIQPD